MRESLTIFAVALILVLSALLVGPYLIDWNKQRDWLAAKLSHTIGAQVTIGGSVDVKLLPRPLFRATRVAIQGRTPQDPRVSAEGLDAELSINSLLQGAVEFVDATALAPRIEITTRDDGSLVASSWDVTDPQRFMFRRITIRSGAVVVRDEAGRERGAFSGVDAQGEAETLFGPLRMSGHARSSGGDVRFRLTTGAYANRRLRVKLVADDLKPTTHVDLDGTLSVATPVAGSPDGAALAFAGTVSANGSLHVADGAAPVPWQVTAGDMKLDGRGLSSTALEMRAGADQRALVGNGALLLDFGAAPSAALKLKARQLDLDRLAVAPAVAPDTPRPKAAQWTAALVDLVSGTGGGPQLPVRLSLDYAIDAVTSGDLTLTDASGTLDIAQGLPVRGKFSIAGPDGFHLGLDGALETGSAAVFKGRIDAATHDLPATVDWLQPLNPDAAEWIARNVPVHSLLLSGNLDAARTGFAARDMTVTLDGSTVTGALALTAGVGNDPPRLFADVKADTIDTEHLPSFDDIETATSGLDLSVALTADSLKLVRSGIGSVGTGPVELHVSKVGPAVTLDTFSVSGLDGASVTGTASLDAAHRIKAGGEIHAADAGPLAALARQAFPNGFVETVAARSPLLSPLSLAFAAEGTWTDGRFVPSLATIKGGAAATRVSVTLTPEPARLFSASTLNVLAVLDAPDAGPLLRQTGFEKAASGLLGPGHLEVSARGTPETGFDTHVSAAVADNTLQFDGVSDGSSGTGRLKASGRNAAPLLRALALANPLAATVAPWDVETDLAWTEAQTTASKLSGHFDKTSVAGALTSAAGSGALTGSLTLDAVPFAGLAGLLLGPVPERPVDAGHWAASAKFANGPDALPPAQLAMQVRHLDLGAGLVLDNTAFQLRLTPSSLGLADLSGDLLGGKAGGTLTLRRDGALASVAGQIRVTDLALRLPSLTGRLSGSFSMAGSGTSPDSLVGSLAGDGALSAAVVFPRFDPRALIDTAKLYDTDTATIDNDAVREALDKMLDRAALDPGPLAGSATIAAGTLRAVGLQGRTASGRTSSEASFDLRTLQLVMRTTLTTDELPKDWKADPPQVTVTWRGPLVTPQREVDSAAFVNGLAARAIARDQERIQLMQDDLRERAFFARRLRAIEEEQRAAREAAERAKTAAAKPPAPAQDPIAAKILSLPPDLPPVRPPSRSGAAKPAGSPQAPPPTAAGPITPDPLREGLY